MTTDLPLVLDRAADVPLAAQLADALRGAAAAGALRPGDRLPSTRDLATRLGVSRTVTTAAYEQLVAEGWASGHTGAGTFVTAAVTDIAAVPARATTGTAPPSDGIDLRTGAPWAAGIDRAAWRRAWRAAAEAEPLRRPCREGLPEFGLAVLEHLLRHRGLVSTPDEVIATGGTTAALSELVASGVLPRGSVVAVEEPGYQRAVQALLAGGVRVVPAPVDADGLDVDRLPSGVAGVFCTPAHQFPLGGRLSAARRLALVRRAREEGFLVVEDDYDGELRYDVAALPLLASLAPDVVAHLGTASKILTPSLGVGWLVAPPQVADAVLTHRDLTGTGPSPAGQRVFIALASAGDLSRHLRRLRRELAARRAAVVAAFDAVGPTASGDGASIGRWPMIDDRLPIDVPLSHGDRPGVATRGSSAVDMRVGAVRVLGDEAGAHVVVELPSAHAEATVIADLARRGISCASLRQYHAAEPTRFGLPIGTPGVLARSWTPRCRCWSTPSRARRAGRVRRHEHGSPGRAAPTRRRGVRRSQR